MNANSQFARASTIETLPPTVQVEVYRRVRKINDWTFFSEKARDSFIQVLLKRELIVRQVEFVAANGRTAWMVEGLELV